MKTDQAIRWDPGKNGYFKFNPKADRGHESSPSTFAYENRKSRNIVLTKIIDYACFSPAISVWSRLQKFIRVFEGFKKLPLLKTMIYLEKKSKNPS